MTSGLVFRPADWAWSSARWCRGTPSHPEIDADRRLTEWVRMHLVRAGHVVAEPSEPPPGMPGAEHPHGAGTPTH